MLSPALHLKVLKACQRVEELTHFLADPSTSNDSNLLKAYSQEFSSLNPIAEKWNELQGIADEKEELLVLKNDPQFAELAELEYETLSQKESALLEELKLSLVPSDPLDGQECYLEVRAGTGGQEACLFAGDLLRMYLRYCDKLGWKTEILSAHESDLGGYKEAIVKVLHKGAYGQLKFESGGHRVQRIPVTESSGRIHTSACTVAILPEYDEIEEYTINPNDLKIDTYRASGAGGQHVNKTDSAIRITHIPSGLVVECQEDRSQHKNRSKAMSLLKARLLEQEREQQRSERSSLRHSLVGSGDRSERIRTYNYPQGRLTEHRIHLTLYQLNEIMEGDLDPVILPLKTEYHAALIAEIEQDYGL
ncbi:MAG: peptide chain release factor 1 [Gammaproteobacteria bacterium]|nr:peptide chain release factor 1 [Gammaproteobacteria bacterium]